ncbi:GGDEF domain-containing protein [Inquilinus sp. Marseille-Q2685]|uniref:GGDEF domain-containing protein n=1 Tax=Inquilinus sp. Marseille-Q2685 TaxID=2866581 RepID=UPI001CE3F1AD|nr:GGDEF domain-containing protein [Inquilinus sp. Marseille-Q2685]
MDSVLETLVQMFDGTPVLVAAYDEFDRLRYANRAFRAAFFIDEAETPLWSEIMRRNHAAGRGTVLRTEDLEAWLTSTQSRRGKSGFRAYETDLVDGRWLWMTESVRADGWMLCIASNITGTRVEGRAVRQDRDFAVKASYTDELTGIANRRFVTERIEEMLHRPSSGAGGPGCVALLDIDHFKPVNDRHGHQIGDLILRDFARRIGGMVRRSDCFGRMGGDEFLLVLPRTSIGQAVLLVERMLAAVRTARPVPDRGDLAYTFSAGLAEGHPGDTVAGLYARADKALYSAKTSGRNRICREGPEPDRPAVAR